jgi:hypothetical protein
LRLGVVTITDMGGALGLSDGHDMLIAGCFVLLAGVEKIRQKQRTFSYALYQA